MSLPHVLLVSSVFPPASGGPSLQTAQLAEELSLSGWRASVLTYGAGTENQLPGTAVAVHRIDPRVARGRLRRNASIAADVDSVVDRLRPDLVHVQVAEGALPLLAGLSARRRGIPALVKFSADHVWNRLNRDRFLGIPYERIHSSSPRARSLWAFQWAALHAFPLVWATSPFQEEALRRIYGLGPERVHLLPNLVRIEPSPDRPRRTREREIVAVTVSRVVPWKGIDVCIRALGIPEAGSVRLRIVGSGPPEYVAALSRLARDHGLEDRVEFRGGVAPDLVRGELDQADVFVTATLYEPFGIVLVEAMAAGLPVVATRVGGVPYVVEDGATGLLVGEGDVQALGRALGRMAADPTLRDTLAERGHRSCARFDLRAHLPDVLQMYARAMRTRA